MSGMYAARFPVSNATSESSPASNSSRHHAPRTRVPPIEIPNHSYIYITQLVLSPLGDTSVAYHREIILKQAYITGPPDHSGHGLSRMADSGQQPPRTDLTAATARSHLSPFGSLGLYPHSAWPTIDHPCSKSTNWRRDAVAFQAAHGDDDNTACLAPSHMNCTQ